MNKARLLKKILAALQTAHKGAVAAAAQAHETATDTENIAENKYDTLGLEAAYLAHGQSIRVIECANSLEAYQKLSTADFSPDTPIKVGSLVHLSRIPSGIPENHDAGQFVFLGPSAGGLKIDFEGREVFIITTSAPLGQAIIGRCRYDEVEITLTGVRDLYEIISIS